MVNDLIRIMNIPANSHKNVLIYLEPFDNSYTAKKVIEFESDNDSLSLTVSILVSETKVTTF
jgi:hypothetical protein